MSPIWGAIGANPARKSLELLTTGPNFFTMGDGGDMCLMAGMHTRQLINHRHAFNHLMGILKCRGEGLRTSPVFLPAWRQT